MDENLYKINRITAMVDMEDDEALVNLYKTNQLIGTIQYQKLDMVSPRDSELSVRAYGEYMKDVVINLINNGGLEGYYYEEKQSIDGIKYNLPKFRSSANEFIAKILGDIKFVMTGGDISRSIEYYKDGSIKDSVMDFGIKVSGTDLYVRCEIKSGQLCKPKIMIYNNNEHNFNITNIKHIMKG